ncbi:hypothetical protein [Myroides odoratus]|uniref:hypothetical protein n=1 Tax=Myroides odoratus TaxID=256 RepID=UPI0039AF6325
MKKAVLFLVFLFVGNIYSQERVSLKLDIEDAKMRNEENAIDLQEYIESIYLNSTKFFNYGALPLVKKGEFSVILIDSNSSKILKKSSDFKGIAVDKIESFEYKKTPSEDFINGTFATSFGIISIKIKKD